MTPAEIIKLIVTFITANLFKEVKRLFGRRILLIFLLSLSISTLSFVVFIAEYSYIVNTFGQLSIISPQINSGHYTHDILLGIDKFIVFGKWKALIIGLSHTFHFKESGFDIVIPTALVFVLWTAFIVYKLRGGAKRVIVKCCVWH